MLGKLLKYEYKATSRYFIGLYIVLALLTIGNKVMITIEATTDIDLKVVDILFGMMQTDDLAAAPGVLNGQAALQNQNKIAWIATS